MLLLLAEQRGNGDQHINTSQQTNGFDTAHPCLIDPSLEILAQSNPMMRFLQAVSTTSLVTTVQSGHEQWNGRSSPPSSPPPL
jgi:hypothetical protein